MKVLESEFLESVPCIDPRYRADLPSPSRDIEGGRGFVRYLGSLLANFDFFDPIYTAISDLDTTVRCQVIACARIVESEVKRESPKIRLFQLKRYSIQ